MKKNSKGLLKIISLFLGTILVVLFLPLTFPDNKNNGLLVINEIMPKNTKVISNDYDQYSDWIEIYNGYDYDVNLEGYYLKDNEFGIAKWQFPSLVLESKAYLIIYADGLDRCNIETKVCHTNFKLDKKGETIVLMNDQKDVLSKIKYRETNDNTSFGLNDDQYVYFYLATPGNKNDRNISTSPITSKSSDIKLRINEYMTKNETVLPDADHDYSSWIELYNYGEESVNLGNLYLTDDEKYLKKYNLPTIQLEKDNYLVIYTSGKKVDYQKTKQVHTSFVLNDKDSTIILSTLREEIIDKVNIVTLSKNVSSGYYNSKYYYYIETTPNLKNSSNYYNSLLKLAGDDRKIVINEVSALNPEAIEIKNVSEETINLKNYKIGDKSSKPVNLPNIELKPNSYHVVYSSNNFSINNRDDVIYLYDSNNYVIDEFSIGKLRNGVSTGINDLGNKVWYKTLSFGSQNNHIYYLGYSSDIKFSKDGGYVKKGEQVGLSNSDGGTIYYTTNGSFPTTSSKVYTTPINIDKTMVIKAINIKENYLESDVISRTFFVNDAHDIAIVSISTIDSELFSYNNGLFSELNYKKDIERKVSFEFYESDGSLEVSTTAGIKLSGQDSREYPQKSIAVYFREKYGKNEINYPFFGEDSIKNFSSLLIRNSGEDVVYLKIKDIFLSQVLVKQMDIDLQDYRPVAVYLNGKYWGYFNIRDKVNAETLANYYDLDSDKIDLIKGINTVQSGSIKGYNELVTYLKTHDTTDPKVYKYLKSQIDIQELINYWIVQTYYQNTDTGNIRWWRASDGSTKWRWVLYDQDWSMWPGTYQIVNNSKANFNLTYPFKLGGHGTGQSFSTRITYELYKNKEFRDLYLKTLAYHLKYTFESERCIAILNRIVKEVENEMPKHISRWTKDFEASGYDYLTINTWYSRIEQLKTMFRKRRTIVLNNIKSQFGLTQAEYNAYFGDI